MRRQPRGQTLVLFALSMLFMVVMVCITLAIGMRAREKIELQTLADATAYSNAVATARTYNTIAVWTRAQISHMVVLAGAQSHISYASWYLGVLNAASNAALLQIPICTAAAAAAPNLAPCCAELGVAADKLSKASQEATEKFKPLDKFAGAEANAMQARAALYGVAQKDLYKLTLKPFVKEGGFSKQLLALAVPDEERREEYQITPEAKSRSEREVNDALSEEGGPFPALPAAHGSRKSAFTRERGGVLPIKLASVLGSSGTLWGWPKGCGHYGKAKNKPDEEDAQELWADDEGGYGGFVTASGCAWPLPPVPGAWAYVRSTHKGDVDDRHRWTSGSAHDESEHDTHTMGTCATCPSVWVRRAHLALDPRNVDAHAADQWLQPKNLVGLERDYAARKIPDPWNLLFRFRFANGGEGVEVDVGRKKGPSRFQKQGVLATAITYYHRHMPGGGDNWQEPPNFFNPFWRATLVPPDVDAQGDEDIKAIAAEMDPDFRQAYQALKAAKFRGIQ